MAGASAGKIVIAGGTNWEGGKKHWLKAVRVFDPASQQWTSARGMETPLAYAPVFCGSDSFAFLGGFDGSAPSRKFALVNSSDPVELRLDLEKPASLVLAAGGAVGDLLIVSGGTDDPANLAGLTMHTYSFQWGTPDRAFALLRIRAAELNQSPLRSSGGFRVSRMADYPGKPFAVAASAVLGDELFLFGGMNYDAAAKAPVNSTEAHAFSPAKNSWRKLRPLAVAARGLCAVALDDHRIYIAGGYTTDFTADAVIYNSKTDAYTPTKPLPYAAMVSLVRLGDHIYCLGGEDKKQSRTDKFFRIPVTDLK